MILSFLSRPYPQVFNIYSVVIPAVISFLLILFLSPLGFTSIDFSERALIALVISLIIAVSTFFIYRLLKKITPSFMSTENWTVGKEIFLFSLILFIITVSITIVLTSVVLFQYQNQTLSPLKMFLHFFGKTAYITLGISILPMIVLILFEQNYYQKKQFEIAKQLSKSLKEELSELKKEQIEKDQNFLFTSDTNELELQVSLKDVSFIKSDGNYIEVHYFDKLTTAKKLIRNRLKNVETSLPNKLFFRCHNRYIINKNFITKINGNARGLHLEVKNSDEIIPVSRSKIKDFETFFK